MMHKWLRIILFVALSPLLTACAFDQTRLRIGILVLVPALLVIGVLWLLNQRGGEENWEEERFPDSDEDDQHEDHHLM